MIYELLHFLAEAPEATEEKKSEGSVNRGKTRAFQITFPNFTPITSYQIDLSPNMLIFSSDAELARVATEKRLSLVKAWEESEKCRAENK